MASPNGGIKAAEKLHQKLEGSALRNILILHCLFLRDLFQGFFLPPDPLVQIRHTLLNLLLNTADHFFLLSREFKEISVDRVRTAAINLGHLLYSAIEIRQHLAAVLQTVGFQKGRRFLSPSGPTKRRPSLCEFF